MSVDELPELPPYKSRLTLGDYPWYKEPIQEVANAWNSDGTINLDYKRSPPRPFHLVVDLVRHLLL